MRETMETLSTWLEGNYELLSINQRAVEIRGEGKVRINDFVKKVFTFKNMSECGLGKLLELSEAEKRSILSNCASEIVTNREAKRKRELRERFGSEGEDALDTTFFDPTCYYIFKNVETTKEFLYIREDNIISDIHPEIYWDALGDVDARKIAQENIRHCITRYDPYDISDNFNLVEYDQGRVYMVNTYSPPKWRKSFLKKEEVPDLPDPVWRFMEHLFPVRSSYMYTMKWLYRALVDRNETYLVLNGRKGCGKGVFSAMLKALVGFEHYTEAPSSLLSSQFNSSIDEKRMIIFDEMRVHKSEHTKLKRLINKYQAIEKKGVDAENSKEIYNSYAIMNNDVTDMYLETDDRRFSVMEITDRKLEESMSSEEITTLLEEFEDEDSEIVRQMGFHIFHHWANEENFEPYIGRKFWKLAFYSLAEWQKFLVERVMSKSDEGEGYSVRTLRREFEKDNSSHPFPRNAQKIEDFLKNYSHEGRGQIAKIERDPEDNKDWLLYPLELEKDALDWVGCDDIVTVKKERGEYDDDEDL